MSVFGSKVTFDEAVTRIKELSEPQNPVNPNKLVQKRGLSTSHLLSNGSRKVLKRVHASNIIAFNEKIGIRPPPPAWFVSNSHNLEPLVEMLLAVNVSPLPAPSLSVASPHKKHKPTPSPLFADLLYIKPDYKLHN